MADVPMSTELDGDLSESVSPSSSLDRSVLTTKASWAPTVLDHVCSLRGPGRNIGGFTSIRALTRSRVTGIAATLLLMQFTARKAPTSCRFSVLDSRRDALTAAMIGIDVRRSRTEIARLKAE